MKIDRQNWKLKRKMADRMVGGVCSGIGDLIDIDPVWIRLIFGLLTIFTSLWFLLVYFVLAIILPIDDVSQVGNYKKLYRVKDKNLLGGVCKGLEDYLKIDVVIIRAGFILGTILAGIGPLAYIILWIITPKVDLVVATN